MNRIIENEEIIENENKQTIVWDDIDNYFVGFINSLEINVFIVKDDENPEDYVYKGTVEDEDMNILYEEEYSSYLLLQKDIDKVLGVDINYPESDELMKIAE